MHTNLMQYPRIMQHTHARWEQVDSETVQATAQNMLSGRTHGDDTGGSRPVSRELKGTTDTIFTSLPPHFARNFMIVDTYAHGPPTSTFGFPGLLGSVEDVGPTGLTDISEDVIAVLPEESRKAFLEMRDDTRRWQSSWGTEGAGQDAGNCAHHLQCMSNPGSNWCSMI